MGRISVIGLLVLGLALVGCGNGEDVLAPPQDEVAVVAPGGAGKGGPAEAGLSPGPVAESVTGSGHFTRGEDWRTFSFTAKKYEDGSVDGRFQVRQHDGGPWAKGVVTCLGVADNMAWLEVFIEKSNIPQIIGARYAFRVVDNGEGANDPVDQVSLLIPNQAAPGNYCNAKPPTSVYDIEAGNVQVK